MLPEFGSKVLGLHKKVYIYSNDCQRSSIGCHYACKT